MSYLTEIKNYIASANDGEKLKEYYNKAFDNLKATNSRSNSITVFVLILLVCGNFPDLISEDRILGFKVSADLIAYISPLLLSFFAFEWCLLARRRRELLRVLRELAYRVFSTPRLEKPFDLFEFSLLNRNLIPTSLMVEMLNVDKGKRAYDVLFGYTAMVIPLVTAFFIGRSYYISFCQAHLPAIAIFCNVLGAFCWVLIIIFYKNDIQFVLANRSVGE